MIHTLRSSVNPATSFLAKNKFLYLGNNQPNTYLSNYSWYHFLSRLRSICIATRCRPGRTIPRQIQWNREKRHSLFLLGEVDTTLYDGTLPHRSVQRSTIQFQPDSRPTFDTESPNCDSRQQPPTSPFCKGWTGKNGKSMRNCYRSITAKAKADTSCTCLTYGKEQPIWRKQSLTSSDRKSRYKPLFLYLVPPACHSCAIVVSQLCQADVTVVTGRCHILALSLSVV